MAVLLPHAQPLVSKPNLLAYKVISRPVASLLLRVVILSSSDSVIVPRLFVAPHLRLAHVHADRKSSQLETKTEEPLEHRKFFNYDFQPGTQSRRWRLCHERRRQIHPGQKKGQPWRK